MRLTKAAAEEKWGVRLDDEAVEKAMKQSCYCGVRSRSSHSSKLQAPTEAAGMRKTMDLPDGHEVRIVDEVCMAPSEVLFHGKGELGSDLVTISLAAVKGLHRPLQEQMWNNVQLVGGLNQLPGYTARVTAELNTAVSPTVYGHDDCSNATFIGASILSSLPGACEDECFTRTAYDERGPSAFFRFCAPFSNC